MYWYDYETWHTPASERDFLKPSYSVSSWLALLSASEN